MKKLIASVAMLLALCLQPVFAQSNIIRSSAPIQAGKVVDLEPVKETAEECLDTAYWMTYGEAYGVYSGAIRAITWSSTGDVVITTNYTTTGETYDSGGYTYVRKDKYLANGPIDYYHVCRSPSTGSVATPVVPDATGQEECTPKGATTAVLSWIAMGPSYGANAGTAMMISWLSYGDILAQADMANPVKSDFYDKDGYRYLKKSLYQDTGTMQYFSVCRIKL